MTDADIVPIFSENARFQELYALMNNRKKRMKRRQFIVEGVKSLESLMSSPQWQIDVLLYEKIRRGKRSDWANNIIETLDVHTHHPLETALIKKLSQKEKPSEILAVASMQEDDPTRIPVSEGSLVVIIDRPASRGNLGTLIRSAEAFGAAGVVMTGHSVDLYHPEVIRATVGSFFTTPVVRLPSHNEVFEWVGSVSEEAGVKPHIVGATEDGDTLLSEHTFSSPTFLVMGNERFGLSQAYKESCDTLIKIPMHGDAAVSSLNVACAGTVLLYAASIQKSS